MYQNQKKKPSPILHALFYIFHPLLKPMIINALLNHFLSFFLKDEQKGIRILRDQFRIQDFS